MNQKLKLVREALGTPFWETDEVMLYQGDSVELLKLIPPALIDLTVTSPPYNIGKDYEQQLPLSHFIDWCSEWMHGIYESTDPGGAFWLNLGYTPVPGKAKALPLTYLLWDKNPFQIIQEVVWNYGAGVAGRLFLSPRNEKFIWFVKSLNDYTFNLDSIRDPNVKYPNQKKHGKLRVNQEGKNPTDVWQIPKVTTGQGMIGRRASKERTKHPAQFPEAAIDRIIKGTSNPDDLIFDPFLGSGTTAAVAVANGRVALGFEIREDYISIAIERIRKRLDIIGQSRMI